MVITCYNYHKPNSYSYCSDKNAPTERVLQPRQHMWRRPRNHSGIIPLGPSNFDSNILQQMKTYDIIFNQSTNQPGNNKNGLILWIRQYTGIDSLEL